MPNRLARETSPYLLQHQHNPVDWYPWGEEAIARARAENRPILLSVGYSACHWCHVMETESFENPDVARLMNEGYVCIKVDREERPDLDQIYQGAAQAVSGGGGWPLTVFLTPDLRPFFAGTYFPPEDRYGRPGFPRVLESLAEAYRTDPQAVERNAARLMSALTSREDSLTKDQAASAPPARGDLEAAVDALLGEMDWINGGLGVAPKFPTPPAFSFLWRASSALGVKRADEAVRITLSSMAKRGIFDQVDGGFHRYSVDQRWGVPHFEKMLYDNGLLLKLYSEVLLSHQAAACLSEAERDLFDRAVTETSLYVLDEMTSPEGAFYSAQDADSDGEEGEFNTWTRAELTALLDSEELRAFELHEFERGRVILEFAGATAGGALDRARLKLRAARRSRQAPLRDDKIIAGWNGLMISGLIWAAQALESLERNYLGGKTRKAAARAFDFATRRLASGPARERLHGTWQGSGVDARGKFNGYLDDYAFLAMAALDLARFSVDPAETGRYMEWGERWLGTILGRFRDEGSPGYFFTSDDHEKLVLRPKAFFDQGSPAGGSVALSCLAALAELDPGGRGARYRAELEFQISGLLPLARRSPLGAGELWSAVLLATCGPVTVAGRGAHLAVRHGHVFQKADLSGGPLVVCHAQACGLPAADPVTARAEALEKCRLR